MTDQPPDSPPPDDERRAPDPWAPPGRAVPPPPGPTGQDTVAFGAGPLDTRPLGDVPVDHDTVVLDPAPAPEPAVGPAPGSGWSPLAWVAVVAVVGLLAGLLGGVVGFTAASRHDSRTLDPGATLPAVSGDPTARPTDSVAGVAAAVLPTVVQVSVSATDGTQDTGSGFVIRRDGYILTNNHVVAPGATGGSISVTFNDGQSADATIVGRDTSYDLAVLKVGVHSLPTAVLGDSDAVQVGDPVLAIGSPLGLSGTVTAGIVSAKDRPVSAGDGAGDVSYISALQTDAAINPGNSGGPLVDMKSRVIGINSSIATLGGTTGGQTGSIGLGFAIPINQARRIAEEIIRTGEAQHPIIGVELDVRYAGPGAKVAARGTNGQPAVVPGGPADQAGIQPGDVITAIDGVPVTDAEQLIVAIRTHAPGDTVTLTIKRDGQETDVSVTLAPSTG